MTIMVEVDYFLFSPSLPQSNKYLPKQVQKLVSNPSSLTTVAHRATSSTFPSPTFGDSLLFPTSYGEFSKQGCYLTPLGEAAGALQTGHLSVSFLQ